LKVFLVSVCLLCLLIFALPATAQTVTSDLLGTVRDPSGALIPSTLLIIRRVDTGEQRQTATNADGVFRVFGLDAGTYEVRFEKPGFKTLVMSDVKLLVNQQGTLNPTLQIGDRQENVEVIGNVSLLEGANSGLSAVVTDEALHELPLNGLDVFQLTLLNPGVLPMTNAGPSLFGDGGISKASVQGARPSMNNLTLDGTDINDPAYHTPPGGVGGVQLGVGGIQEFRVLLNNYSAESGRNAGANVQYITRSGGNEYHGSLYEFHRNAALDARNFFDAGDVPPFVRNQFGATLGGPIRRGKTFFFLNWESLLESKSITANLSVPDANAHNGLLPSATDPTTLVNVGIDPRIVPFMDLYPLSNAGSIGRGLGLLRTSERQKITEHYGMLRLDHLLTPSDKVTARYVFDDSHSTAPFANTLTPGFPSKREIRNQYLMFNWQKVLGPNVLNEAKASFSRIFLSTRESFSTPLSISLTPDRALGAVSIAGMPQLGSSFLSPVSGPSNTFQLIDNLSHKRGNHMLKTGVDFNHIQVNGRFDSLVNGVYLFNDFGLPAASNNPALELFLRGIPFLYLGADPQLSNSSRGYRQTYLGLYAQDDWQVAPQLTLNLGIRWEHWSNPDEAYARLSNVRNILTDTGPTSGKIWEHTPRDLWSPRLGFAWTPGSESKTVIRGGVGVMRDQIWANLYSTTRFYEPYFRTLQYVLPTFQAPPNGIASLIGFGGPPSVAGVFGITYKPDFPYYVQYDLNLQHELPRNFSLQVGYVGSRGIHLLRSGEANPFTSSLGRRLNPNLGSTIEMVTDGQSVYNAGEVSVQRRFSNGLSTGIAYTYSKSIDDQSGTFPSDFTSESGISQNFFNREGDRARSSFDRKHAFVWNFVYDLPFAKFGSPALTDGWSISGILSLYSGLPFTANLGSFDNSGILPIAFADRPNLKPGVNPCATTGDPERWFDPSIFTLPAMGQFGNSGRNTMCGPPLKNLDVALIKRIKLHDRANLQFRAEFFNVFNHPNFDVPINTQGPTGSGGNGTAIFVGRRTPCDATSDSLGCGLLAPDAGRIMRTVMTSRQIQLAVKLGL